MEKNKKTDAHFFDNGSFFRGEQRVYIHVSSDFQDYVGVLHEHEFIEAVYVISGKAVHTVGNREYQVSGGDVVIINSRVPHKFTEICESEEKFVAYDLMFTPDFLDAKAINMSEFESLKNSFLLSSLFPESTELLPDMHVSKKRYSDYGELFSKIYYEFQGKEKGYVQLIRAYVIELIIKFFRDLEKDGVKEASRENVALIHSAMEYIERNLNVKLHVDEIASNIFLSPDYFRKLFKKVTGQTVSGFQQALRVDNAKKLLTTTDKSVEEICFSVGYNDLKSFYQAFKKETGKTPNEYRKKV
ncbi:MAG: AraC family transcriptional regulator [Clostridia bacterium]|nr:AraC family transcriptional regulator [Clostridia bacterium]